PPRTGLRRHLLRDDEPAACGPRGGAGGRYRARRGLADVLELEASRRGRGAGGLARVPRRRRDGRRRRLAARRLHRRSHRRRIGTGVASQPPDRGDRGARRRRGRRAHHDRRDVAVQAAPRASGAQVIPFRQELTIGRYLLKQRLRRNEKFPLLVELEPLYQCNLACSFCGKIQYPEHILKKRMPVDQALAAIEESGAPMVSIAGGEPLVHPEVHVMARELIKRKKFVYLCTNGILMKKKMDNFEPSPYFAWVVHLDGMRERHDQFVEREGTFDKAVDAI